MNKLFDLTERFHYSARFIYPAVNYMFKVNNRNTRTVCEICSKLTIRTPEWRHWRMGVWTSAFVINPFQGNVPFQFPPQKTSQNVLLTDVFRGKGTLTWKILIEKYLRLRVTQKTFHLPLFSTLFFFSIARLGGLAKVVSVFFFYCCFRRMWAISDLLTWKGK